ncbi:MAG: helix-turn-helix domain-containing protein [Actinomycetota bacterium]
MDVSVRRAAEMLGLSPRTVRALIADGRLPARRIDDRQWIVDSDDARRLLGRARPPGRPLSPRSAWAILALAEGIAPKGLSASEMGRARRRLASLAAMPPRALAGRAAVHRFRAHSGVLGRIADDDRLVRAGVTGALNYGADVIALELIEGYVRPGDLDPLAAAYALQVASEGRENVILRVPIGNWPFEGGARVAPRAVVAVDLIDSGDDRSVRAGHRLLDLPLGQTEEET